MAKDLLRQGQLRRQQHGWPVDRVEPQDVLANEVKLGWPAAGQGCGQVLGTVGIGEGGDVAQQRVKPDVKGVSWLMGDRNAPGQIHPGDGEIPQTCLHKSLHLPPSAGGTNEGFPGNKLGDGLLEMGEAEKQILLITPLQRAIMDGAAGRLAITGVPILELFTGDAIPAPLLTQANVPVVADPFVEPMDQPLVLGGAGAHKAVMADADALPEGRKVACHAIHIVPGGDTGGYGAALNLEAMLVTAGDQTHLISLQPVPAGNGICCQGGVDTADVGLVVDVVKRRCERETMNHATGRAPEAPVQFRILTPTGSRRSEEKTISGCGEIPLCPLVPAPFPSFPQKRDSTNTFTTQGPLPAPSAQELTNVLITGADLPLDHCSPYLPTSWPTGYSPAPWWLPLWGAWGCPSMLSIIN